MNTRKPIELWQIEPILYQNLPDRPTTWNELGLSGSFPFVRYDAPQPLTQPQKDQVWSNIGLPPSLDTHDPVTLGTANGLQLNNQQLSLGLATTSANGAMASVDKQKLQGGNIIQGSGITVTGTTAGKFLWTSAGNNVTFAVDATVLRVSGEQIITGLKETRRAGPNTGVSAQIVKRYSIGPDNLYKLDLMNTQNVQAPDGEVQWFYRFTSNAGANNSKARDMIGFARGAVTIFGGRAVPDTYYNTIVTSEGANVGDPNYRYPLRQYAYGITQMEQGAVVGTDAIRVPQITGDTKLYVEGGIRTAAPDGGLQATFMVGSYASTSDNTANIKVLVKVGDRQIELIGRDVTP